MKKLIYYLLGFAALAQGVLWVNVFRLLHDGFLVYIGGIPAGLAIVGLVVYAANALPRVQSKRAQMAGWIFLTLVVIVEPIVLGFANYPVIMHTPITWLGANVVAGGASLTITLALILGALVDRSLIPQESKAQVARKPAKAAGKKAQVARKSMTDENLLAYLAANAGASHQQVADYFGVSRQAVGPRVKKLYEVKP